MIRILSIIGTRPEAIKMAPVLRALGQYPDIFESRVCVTGQHREMLDQMLTLFSIVPDYDLDIMEPGQTLTDTTVAVMLRLSPILHDDRPHWVLVQGDTTTTMAASLAAYYQGIPVAHVEAGLRTHNNLEPMPEEVNRRIASVIADLHFAPTQRAAENLRREATPDAQIVVTGNTVIDAFHQVSGLPFDPVGSPVAGLPVGERPIILVTAHRREASSQIHGICRGLQEIAEVHDVHLVFPVHPNPNVQQPVYRALGGIDNISLVPPLDYQPLVWTLKHAHLVITDSGGLQEEAAGLGKPVLVLRDRTERPEGIEAGTARLVGTDPAVLTAAVAELLRDGAAYESMANPVEAYGTGHAGRHIAWTLSKGRADRRWLRKHGPDFAPSPLLRRTDDVKVPVG